jgi:hypothetical protein
MAPAIDIEFCAIEFARPRRRARARRVQNFSSFQAARQPSTCVANARSIPSLDVLQG